MKSKIKKYHAVTMFFAAEGSYTSTFGNGHSLHDLETDSTSQKSVKTDFKNDLESH